MFSETPLVHSFPFVSGFVLVVVLGSFGALLGLFVDCLGWFGSFRGRLGVAQGSFGIFQGCFVWGTFHSHSGFASVVRGGSSVGCLGLFWGRSCANFG